jgi:hypothetical protein
MVTEFTRIMRTREELAYAAGLFEGEGTFTMGRPGVGGGRQLHAVIKMTDREPLEAFQEAVGFGPLTGPFERNYSHSSGWKPIFVWRVGSREQVQALIALLWPWLSPRRRQRARELLTTPVSSLLPGQHHRDIAHRDHDHDVDEGH